MAADDLTQALERIANLEHETKLLREQTRQAERIRRMWQESVAQLKRARQELLAKEDELRTTNHQLEDRVRELNLAKQYVERLAYSDEQVVENMQEGVVVTDKEGTIQAVNPAFTATTGYSAEEVIGLNPRVLKSDRHDKWFYKNLWSSLLDSGRWQGEIWNRRKNGDVYPELLSISAIRDWSEQTINYIAVFTEITDRKRMEEALRSSKEKLHAITNALNEAVLMLDNEERITFANPEAVRLTRIALPKLLGKRADEVLQLEELRGPFMLPQGFTVNQYLEQAEAVSFDDTMLDLPGGEHVPIALASNPIVRDRSIVGAVVAFHDISHRREVENQLRKLSRAIEHSPSMVIITDLHGCIEYVNPRFTEITGYAPDEVIGRNTSFLKSGHTPADLYRELWETISAGGEWRGEFQNRKKNGELFWQMVSISPIVDSAGNITHFVSVEEDITERKRAEERIWRQANFDGLTGLPNRRLFQDRLEQALGQSLRRKHRGALLFLDVDRFKYVNDTLGHEAGDELLVQVAQRLRDCVRETDTVARLGGDEFTIILPEIADPTNPQSVTGKVLTKLSQAFQVKGHEVFVSASVGLTLFPDDGETTDTLLKNADAAMYRAKEGGRDTYCFYTEEINQESMHKLALETELRRAQERGELYLVYQPIVAAQGHQLLGMEALLRWNSANFGLVPPTEFIPIAENAGLMPSIGQWVLETASRQLQMWRQQYDTDLWVAVNLSLVQLRSDLFMDQLQRILEETGLPATNLELEITESIVMDQPEHYIALTRRLVDAGVRLAIDDFGTGYSSLSHLKRLSASTLKVDQSFVTDLPTDKEDATIVRTIISMAHNLNMEVTAEGVEQGEQEDFLRESGCNRLQGFRFARPLTADTFEELLKLRYPDQG